MKITDMKIWCVWLLPISRCDADNNSYDSLGRLLLHHCVSSGLLGLFQTLPQPWYNNVWCQALLLHTLLSSVAPASVHETRAPSARLNKVSCSLVCTFTKQCHGHVVGSRVRPSTWAALTFVLALFLEPLHMYSNAMLRWFYLAPLEHLRGDPLKRRCTNCHNEWMNMFSEIQWRMFWR